MRAFERFLVVQLLTSAVVAVATGAALWVLGMQQAALWGLLAGVFNSIPYYGPLLVPMMMVIKVVCDHAEPLHPVGHLLGD